MENQNETFNDTDYFYIDIHDLSKESSIAILIILAILFIFGIILNIISIIAILKNNKLEIISILILNLTFADIIYLTGIPLFTMSALFGSWPFGLIGCHIFYLIDYIGMIVGVYSVAALSFERFLVVTDNKMKLEKLILFIYLTIIWLVGILFSLPFLLNIQLGKSYENTYTCEVDIDDIKKNIFFGIKFVLMFLIPIVIIMFSSIKLILFLKKKSFFKTKVIRKISIKVSKTEELRIISNESSVLIQKDNKKLSIKENTLLCLKSNHVQKKAIKIVLSIVFMFIIQWLPLWTGILFLK
jgi:hypothetical protein